MANRESDRLARLIRSGKATTEQVAKYERLDAEEHAAIKPVRMYKQDELRLEALDKLQSLESTVGSIRRDLEAGKLHRLSETGHLILLAAQVDLVIARLVEVSRKT